MFTAPQNGRTLAVSSASAISELVAHRAATIGDAGSRHAFARHDGNHPVREVAQQIDRELRTSR
jgi:hypothetical protein